MLKVKASGGSSQIEHTCAYALCSLIHCCRSVCSLQRQVAFFGIRVVGVPFWDFISHPSIRRISAENLTLLQGKFENK